MKKAQIIHGEVNFFQTAELPKGAKKVDVKENFFVVGESETHGNDHRVAVLDKEQVKFFERDGVLYMVNTEATKVYCPKSDRHDTVEIPAGTWEIDKAKEYDYISEMTRNVRD